MKAREFLEQGRREGDRSATHEPLRKSELRYRRLFETAQDGILILDGESGAIVDVNPFLVDLLGYPFENLIGKYLWDIGEFNDIAASKASFAILQNKEYVRYENLPLKTHTGEQRAVEFISNLYDVEGEKVIQCNIREIGERAKANEASCNRVATLEAANKSKDDVMAMLSHELRSPLTAISYAIDLLELGHDVTEAIDKTEVPPAFDRSAVALVRRNLQAVVQLINEVIDLTHMAKGPLQLKLDTIDAHEVIRLVIKNIEGEQKSRGVGIEFHLQARHSGIRADSGKLAQVLSNLIGNGLKFTPRGGKVSIVTRDEESGKLVIEVSDTGIGISPTMLQQIFLPFSQGDPSIYQRFGGLGLGLSIARTLVESQGGTLEAESRGLDEGAKFTARFKIDDSAPITAGTSPAL
jgi:PAS domain S-box-containing protein